VPGILQRCSTAAEAARSQAWPRACSFRSHGEPSPGFGDLLPHPRRRAHARRPARATARGSTGIGFLYRLGHGGDGWGWKYGLSWYSAEVDRDLGGDARHLGRLRIRPLLVGYGYSHRVGSTRVTAKLLGGYAFTSFVVRDSFVREYRAAHGVASVDTSSSNTLVLRPEVSMWRDLGDKIGWTVSAGYIVARPGVTVISALGRDRKSVRADMFTVKTGLVYSVY
jgi:hypothetical protein